MKLNLISLLGFVIFLVGFTQGDRDGGSGPEQNRWQTHFVRLNIGEFPRNIPKEIVQASKELVTEAIPEEFFKMHSYPCIFDPSVGPVLLYFGCSYWEGQPAGVFYNAFYEQSMPPKLLDVSNLVVFYPDTSQAIAIQIPNSERKFMRNGTEITIASYYIVSGKYLGGTVYDSVLTVELSHDRIDRIYFGIPRAEEGRVNYFATYESGGTQTVPYRFREELDWGEEKKGKNILYEVPSYMEPVLPSYLEDLRLRQQFLEFPNELLNQTSKKSAQDCGTNLTSKK